MTQVKPRIFISHSSQDRNLTEAVVKALSPPSANHPGFDILVDKDCLKAGQEWPVQLHAMMAYAHAGLLLFTRAAMDRPDWIRKEAYILTWRRSLDPKFKVFYVYLDDVTEQDLTDRGFAPAHLGLIQRLSSKNAVAIAEEIRTFETRSVEIKTPFEELAFYLGQHLKLDQAAVEDLATGLGAPPVPWLPGEGNPGINRIAARVLAGQFGTIENLGSLIGKLKILNIPKESLKIVMRWVGPHWLPQEAAGRLAAVTHHLWENGMGGWAVINGHRVIDYTAKMFVYKVLPFRFQCRVAQVESGTAQPDADYYTRAICNWVRREDQLRPRDEQVGYPDDNDQLMQELKADEPFLFVPIRAPDKETVEELRARFPTVVFLLWTGKELESIGYDLPAISLEPAVDGQREEAEFRHWRNALMVL
jgi:hypothetical protein